MVVMIIALALLIAAMIVCIWLSHRYMEPVSFFCTWLLIGMAFLYSFIKIVKWHDRQETKKYWKDRQKENKNIT